MNQDWALPGCSSARAGQKNTQNFNLVSTVPEAIPIQQKCELEKRIPQIYMTEHEKIKERSQKAIEGLKPKTFWDYILKLSQIPRESQHEEKVSVWLLNVGKELGVEVEQDKTKNVIYRVPASPGCEHVPIVTLQAHMDMVCDKENEKEHNFDTDPIELVRMNDGNWICAERTTLGADNGVGVCMMLALVKHRDEFKHGRFECLFTSDEEMGMGGVIGLEKGWFKGEFLVNLDSEDWGEIFVGCAGGGDSTIFSQIEYEECKNLDGNAWVLELDKLLGGHSGGDIHLERCNANKFLSRFIFRLLERKLEFCLCDYHVPSPSNVIPKSGKIVLRFEDSIKPAIEEEMQKQMKETLEVFGDVKDVNAEFSIKKVENEKFSRCWKQEFLVRFNRLMLSIPHGVTRTSHIKELNRVIETSNNLANAYVRDGRIEIGILTRSMGAVALKDLIDRISCIVELSGFGINKETPYPGWKPIQGSLAEKIVNDVFVRMFPEEGPPKVLAVHAGLECGYLLEKKPDMQCVSIGPTIREPHTPRERMEISSSTKFWGYLVGIMEEFAKREW